MIASQNRGNQYGSVFEEMTAPDVQGVPAEGKRATTIPWVRRHLHVKLLLSGCGNVPTGVGVRLLFVVGSNQLK